MLIILGILGFLTLTVIGIYLKYGFKEDFFPTKPKTLITDRPEGSEVILNGEKVDLQNMK